MKRKSIREVVENPQPDEYYVLVTRYYPMELRKRGMKLRDSPIDEWDRELAPSCELLKTFKKQGDWEGYVEAFFEEKSDELIKRKLRILLADAVNKELVLVCIEEDDKYPHCHTWLLLAKAEKQLICPKCGSSKVMRKSDSDDRGNWWWWDECQDCGYKWQSEGQ